MFCNMNLFKGSHNLCSCQNGVIHEDDMYQLSTQISAECTHKTPKGDVQKASSSNHLNCLRPFRFLKFSHNMEQGNQYRFWGPNQAKEHLAARSLGAGWTQPVKTN